jgi:hypothetical protein
MRQSHSWRGGGSLLTRLQDDFPAGVSIPQAGAASLDPILCREESRQRTARPSYRACILSAALALLFSAGAWAQTQLATVSGTITDPSGAVVPGVSVTVVSQGTGLKRSVLTGTAGEFRFGGLPIGNYSLRVEKTGFQSQVREGVELNSAAEVMVNSQLAIGDLSQQATVSANVAAIDSTTSTSAGLLPERSLAALPLDNRDLFSAVALEPGVVPNPSSGPSLLSNGKAGQVAINGIRPNMTNVLIDGMDATDPVWGYSPAGASGFFLGLNELEEVRVLTQTFNAEYGGHGGAVIDMTTKAGGNQFHGSLWELYRGASLDAKNYFDLGSSPIPAFVRNQFGAGLCAHPRKRPCRGTPSDWPSAAGERY